MLRVSYGDSDPVRFAFSVYSIACNSNVKMCLCRWIWEIADAVWFLPEDLHDFANVMELIYVIWFFELDLFGPVRVASLPNHPHSCFLFNLA